MTNKQRLHWVVGTIVTLTASSASAQQVPDMFGQAARTLDQFRLQQSIGMFAMVLFSVIGGCALALRKLAIGFTALFLVLGTYVWYSDIGRQMITVTGTPIAP